MPRLALTMALMRFCGTLMAAASRLALSSSGSRKSCFSVTPGWMGMRVEYLSL